MDFGGKEALKIAKVLSSHSGDELTDEKIADVSKVKLNIVRRILYILNENKLTEFRRVRDKRSGWFIYFWKSKFENLEIMLKERRRDVVQKLEKRMLFEEENYFFLCNNGCTERFIFIDALEYNFQCPNCDGGTLGQDPNKEKVDILRKTIIKFRTS